jgi:hypothetical protein
MTTTSLLRSLIRETLLLEEVYGAQAVVYHGTEADPKELIEALVDDAFEPGRGSGSLYGQGLYTVYDLKGSQTEAGYYGRSIIKLKLNLYGYIIFDPEVALQVYKAPLSIAEQAKEIGAGKDIIEKLKSLHFYKSEITSPQAKDASKFLKGRVKGIVYTGENDGRCAVAYDATTAVPIAWKYVEDDKWNSVSKDYIKPSLRRSASGDWQEEKYEKDFVRLLKKLQRLPENQRVVREDLEIDQPGIVELPQGLKVEGFLYIGRKSKITSLPKNLKVENLSIESAGNLKSLPQGLQIKENLYISNTSIASLPPDIKVGGNVTLYTDIVSLPPNLVLGGSLAIDSSKMNSLPSGLQVGENLILSLNTQIKSLPDDLQVEGTIAGFKGDKSSVPQRLREKFW